MAEPQLWSVIIERNYDTVSVKNEMMWCNYVVLVVNTKYTFKVKDVILNRPMLMEAMAKYVGTSQSHGMHQPLDRRLQTDAVSSVQTMNISQLRAFSHAMAEPIIFQRLGYFGTAEETVSVQSS